MVKLDQTGFVADGVALTHLYQWVCVQRLLGANSCTGVSKREVQLQVLQVGFKDVGLQLHTSSCCDPCKHLHIPYSIMGAF